MPVIFISYRRSDSQDVTGRIYDRLVSHYSQRQVFKDVDNIPLGVSFPMHIKQMLTKANVVLVIIGPGWTTAKDDQGVRRLDDENDFVRLEVELALRANMPVIPVLVGNARMPTAAELPPAMQKLVSRNGMAVRPDPDFNNDIGRLFNGIEHLDRLLNPGAKRPKDPQPITVEPVDEPIVVTVAEVAPIVINVPPLAHNPTPAPIKKRPPTGSSTRIGAAPKSPPKAPRRQASLVFRLLYFVISGALGGLLVAGVFYVIEMTLQKEFFRLSLGEFAVRFGAISLLGAAPGFFGGLGSALLPRISRHPLMLTLVWAAVFCGLAFWLPSLLNSHDLNGVPLFDRTPLIAAGYGAFYGVIVGLYARMLEYDRTALLTLVGILVLFALLGFLTYGAGVYLNKVPARGEVPGQLDRPTCVT